MQSNESGGHGASTSTAFCFIPEVAAALVEHAAASQQPPVPLLAAGGVMDGRQVKHRAQLSAGQYDNSMLNGQLCTLVSLH